MENRNTRIGAMLVLRIVAMAMAAVSIALPLISSAGIELYAIVLGIGLFALAVAPLIEPQGSER